MSSHHASFFFKDFTANTDADTVVKHDLSPPVKARFIRFRPTTWTDQIAMRVELFGCKGKVDLFVNNEDNKNCYKVDLFVNNEDNKNCYK